jgi:phenylalanyl-tRNA synthetase beta chain
MRFSERWLGEWVGPAPDGAPLVDRLTMQGLEVDDVVPVGEGVSGVVVGHVVSVEPHPQADRLRVCRVQAGGEPLQVVCGAPNVRAGGVYPFAPVGAQLPDGTRIRAASLRGVRSEGMLCSARELGLGDDEAGLLELDAGLVAGADFGALAGIPDRIIDVNLTPNRADCFSIAGLARDVAAAAGVAVQPVPVPPVAAVNDVAIEGRIEDPADCPVFALRVIRGAGTAARSPLWLRERLRRAGIRSIHPVVDVTNYVMLELGQPLHAYDLARLRGGLSVRRARAGERLELLGGEPIELDPELLVIADAAGPVGLAGIMGGEGSGVTAATADIVLESAAFAPSAIAGRARRFGLQTDASMRFERGVDPRGQVQALERATALLLDIAGGAPGPVVVAGAPPPPAPGVTLRRSRLAQVLGVDPPAEAVTGILARLGFAPEALPDGWRVSPPSFRFDIEREVDLIEEVARIHGYDRIPATALQAPTRLGRAGEGRAATDALRAALAARGYREVITYSFTDATLDARLGGSGTVALRNPIASDLGVMRSSLWPGLVTTLKHNAARQQSRVRLFEVGRCYAAGDAGGEVVERAVVGGLAWGQPLPEQWSVQGAAPTDFFDVKADVVALLGPDAAQLQFVPDTHPALHPGQSARLVDGGATVGWLGTLHPVVARDFDIAGAPVVFELDLDLALRRSPARYVPVSRFPAVRRDLALLVSADLAVGTIIAAARGAGGEALRDVLVFDVYTGGKIETGLKSVALGLILQETSRTLTDADVDLIVGRVVQALARDCNARIRE